MTGILLVEDRPGNREVYSTLFKKRGLEVYEADSLQAGISLFQRVASRISGVVTDIRLDESKNNDRSGVELANQIRRHDSRIPIIGISAYEAEPGYTRIFDSFYHKSSTNIEYDFLSNIVRIKDMIESYNCEKYADAPQRLIRFKEKYAISDSDFQYLISSLPICNKLDSTLLALHDFETIDDASDQRSKTFTIVSADSDLAIRYGLKSDLPVVVTETTENVFVSEIFSLPTIYAYGSTHEEAIELLLESLKDYASQLRDTSSEDLDIIKFGIFLKEIFDA